MSIIPYWASLTIFLVFISPGILFLKTCYLIIHVSHASHGPISPPGSDGPWMGALGDIYNPRPTVSTSRRKPRVLPPVSRASGGYGQPSLIAQMVANNRFKYSVSITKIFIFHLYSMLRRSNQFFVLYQNLLRNRRRIDKFINHVLGRFIPAVSSPYIVYILLDY